MSPIRKYYSRINSSIDIQFSADLTNLNSPRQFEVGFYDGSAKARITYYTDRSFRAQTLPGINITSDTAGNVIVTMEDVQENNAGVYILASAGFYTKCSCLYILGT